MLRMNRLLIISSLFLLVLSAFCAKQQQQVPVDDKGGRCIKGNCWQGIGTYVFPSGNRYVGEFRSGTLFGYGTMYYKNGKSIKGKWKWGRPDFR